jgi:hypothetical protein
MLNTKAAVLLLIAVTALTASKAETFRSPKPRSISFRIVAIAEPVGRSSFSPNRDALLVSVIDEANRAVRAKVVFQYMGYEDPLPTGLLDYDLVHTFKAVRDPSCDETWHSFSTKTLIGPHDTLVISTSVRYTTTGAVPELSANDVLPCYVTQMRGYKGSRRVAVNQMEVSKVERK